KTGPRRHSRIECSLHPRLPYLNGRESSLCRAFLSCLCCLIWKTDPVDRSLAHLATGCWKSKTGTPPCSWSGDRQQATRLTDKSRQLLLSPRTKLRKRPRQVCSLRLHATCGRPPSENCKTRLPGHVQASFVPAAGHSMSSCFQ